MKLALISDVHGNLEALQCVLEDIRKQSITDIYCLGDVIGYGPNPRECLDLVRKRTKLCILGNHDQAAMFDPDGFNPVALRAIYWTREQLESGGGSQKDINLRWDFLGELPRQKEDGDFLFIHGSVREPTNEYVFPEDVYDTRKMQELFRRLGRYSFQGHTHIPGVFTESGEFLSPDECDYEFQLVGDKVMVNVGSVGQPRDSNPNSCYVIIENDTIYFRRVEYPLEDTIRKIYAEAELDNMLGDRLRHGR